jgi:hypothetical protein
MRRRLLPMELEIGDRLPDETWEWEVSSRQARERPCAEGRS